MKNLLLKICGIIIILFSSTTYVFGQESYPVPNKTPTRLFYIQHSNNHNTFVYDAYIKDDSIIKDDPVKEYRIVYTEGGLIKPLTGLQKRMAYGLTTNYISNNLFEMYLAANKKTPFFLTLDSNSKPIVYITINNQKIILDRIFVKLKNNFSVINVEADYILFEGKDFHSQKEVSEKYFLDK
ncbi:DUF4833 domain-containing protein [Xanthomarina sp. F1114]|uniref:DUF4833 domain-containing protein n=1 Tax=Xanthomarina sp. F1114 TaxID=2996019 RepID=UPI00225E5978|nr:DUF4833 domain-containing protein [Xanthomarina sp. F1114]MCX7548654.1 DUF4833 domain-containing protein [Xanthomarina sp. F1114]